MKRGAIQKSKSKAVLVFFPNEIMPLIDHAVVDQDTDRSKFIRNAVREKLGIRPKAEQAA
jgi:metal-responsive CopG/Arc/MetJ family transcriptional regulator